MPHRHPPSTYTIPLDLPASDGKRPKSKGLWLMATYHDGRTVQLLYSYSLMGLDLSKGIQARVILGTGDMYPTICIPRCVLKSLEVIGVIGRGL